MRYYWKDERDQITYTKRVTHAVKMVDSCSRENGVLCTVAWSWLLFLHEESGWKILNQILLEVLMNCIVFDDWRKWSCEVVCVWPTTNSNTIVSMFIWFCYLEWMIYGGKLIWCDLLTSKIYQVEGTVLVSVRIFVNKINTYRLKRW